MKNSKKKITILIISIVVFLLLIFGATFAIIAATTTYDNKNINMAIGSRPIFTAGPSNTIALDIPFVSGTSANVYVIANETSPFNITLQTNYEEKTTCTYDIIWEWDQTSDTSKQYTKTSGAAKEFTVSGSTNGQSFTDVQLNDYNSQDRTTLLYSGSITAAGNNVLNTQNWTFTTSFYKTTQDQSNHRAKQYTGIIKTDNVVCGKDNTPTLNSVMIEKSNQTSSQSNGGSWAIVNETGGLRYEGKDPDNYVCFKSTCTEDELYRIIGKFDVMVDTDNNNVADTTMSALKIIKNKALSTAMAWDSNSGHVWASSTIKPYVNDTWTKPINDVLTARWYVGGYSGYFDTLDVLLPGDTTGTTWDGKVGLMYGTDYGYAVLSSDCVRTIAPSDYNNNSYCYEKNWLYTGSESISSNANYSWTMTPHALSGNAAIMVYSSGSLLMNNSSTLAGIRPVFYIDANTEFARGVGSKSNPYRIVNKIKFTVEGTQYEAEQGMTWGQFVSSPYNTGNFYFDSDTEVLVSTDVIIVNTAYWHTITPNGTYTTSVIYHTEDPDPGLPFDPGDF